MDDLRREFVRLRQRIDRIEEDISKIKFEHRRIAVVVNNGAESSHRQLIGLMEAVGTLGSKVYAIEDDLNNVDKEMADVTEKRLHDPGGSIPYDEARDQLPFIMKVAGINCTNRSCPKTHDNHTECPHCGGKQSPSEQ